MAKKTLILLIFVANLHGFDKIGTKAAQFVKLDDSPTSCVALPTDALGLWHNPSSVELSNGMSFGATYLRLPLGVQWGAVGFATKAWKYGTVGFYALGYNSGRIEITTEEQPEGTGLYYTTGGTVLGAALTTQLSAWFQFGVTGKLITEHVYHESARTVALDVGGTTVLEDFGNLRLSAVIANLGGAMKLSGADLMLSDSIELITESFRLPTRFKFGAALPLSHGWLFAELFHDASLYEGIKFGGLWHIADALQLTGGVSVTPFDTREEFGFALKVPNRGISVLYRVEHGSPIGLLHRVSLNLTR